MKALQATRSRPARPIAAVLLVVALGAGVAGACASSAATASPSEAATILPSASGEGPTPEATAAAETPTASLVPKATLPLDPSPLITLRRTPAPTPAPTVQLPDLWVYTVHTTDVPTCQTEFHLYWGSANPGGPTLRGFQVRIRDVSGGIERYVHYEDIPALDALGMRGGMERITLGPSACGVEHQLTVTVDSGNVIRESDESDNSFTFTYTLASIG